MSRWLDRSHGNVSFRLIQLLAAHCRFDCYLYRINREPSPVCSFCGALGSSFEEKDSAYLMCCKVFEGEPETLVLRIRSCNLHDLVSRILVSLGAWWAVMDFTEAIIETKEDADGARDNKEK